MNASSYVLRFLCIVRTWTVFCELGLHLVCHSVASTYSKRRKCQLYCGALTRCWIMEYSGKSWPTIRH